MRGVQLRYDYWVVRYVPDPIRGEFINIGIIAGKGADWSFRRVGNLGRASRLGGVASQTSSFLKRIEDAIASRLDAVEALIPGAPSTSFGRGEIEDLRVRMNNLVQLSDSRPVLADTAQEAADLAFDLMIVDSDTDVQHRSRIRVVHRLRDAFELRPELIRHVAQFHIAAVGPQEAGIDFAVKDGVVHQLSQVWAFDVKDTRHLQTQIRAWNYLIGLLRADGGTLAKRGHRPTAEIPRRVEINAVFTAPTTADGEQQFEIARDGWHRLGVEAVASSDSEIIVDEAARLLTASS
jgi:hypothetical protein